MSRPQTARERAEAATDLLRELTRAAIADLGDCEAAHARAAAWYALEVGCDVDPPTWAAAGLPLPWSRVVGAA